MQIENRGMAVSNLVLYYQAARLASIMLLWNHESKDSWTFEQLSILLLLSDWILLRYVERSQYACKGNVVYNHLMMVWNKFSEELVPYQTPLLSFIYHPKFSTAARTFTAWKQGNIDHYYQLCLGGNNID